MTDTTNTNPVCVYDFTLKANKNPESVSIDYGHEEIITFLKSIAKKWSFQLERGESDYYHYQGRLSLKLRKRLNQVIKMFHDNNFPAHISITSSENHGNMFYVTKDETREEGPWRDSDTPIPKHLRDTPDWRPWQQSIIDSIDTYDERCVDVIVDDTGNIGKTYLCSWLSVRGKARRVPIQKEPRDISRMIMNCPKVPCYFIDLPRASSTLNMNTMYTAIEEIKNGYAYDDRYHFKEEYFDPPRVWVFTNQQPPMHLLSRDRWRIWYVNNNTLVKGTPQKLTLNIIN